MKKKTGFNPRISVVVILVLIFSLPGFGAQEKRNLKGFDHINFSISGDLILTQGAKFNVTLEGTESDFEKIETIVNGGHLTIKTKSNYNNLKDIKIYVTLPRLKGIALAGSGNIIAENNFEVGNLNITLSGSGDLKFKDLTAENINTSLSGSGDIYIKGKSASTVNISIAGSGDVRTNDLETKDVKVSIAGSGDVKVYATNTLNVDIVGSGDVYYKGKPLVNAKSVGSGSTRSMD